MSAIDVAKTVRNGVMSSDATLYDRPLLFIWPKDVLVVGASDGNDGSAGENVYRTLYEVSIQIEELQLTGNTEELRDGVTFVSLSQSVDSHGQLEDRGCLWLLPGRLKDWIILVKVIDPKKLLEIHSEHTAHSSGSRFAHNLVHDVGITFSIAWSIWVTF